MSDVVLNIAATEARNAAQRCAPEASTEERVRAAFAATKNHWMLTDEGKRFQAGVAGALLALGENHPDYPALLYQARLLGRLSAMMAAANAGLTVGIPEDEEEAPTPLPFKIVNLWHDLSPAPHREERSENE